MHFAATTRENIDAYHDRATLSPKDTMIIWGDFQVCAPNNAYNGAHRSGSCASQLRTTYRLDRLSETVLVAITGIN